MELPHLFPEQDLRSSYQKESFLLTNQAMPPGEFSRGFPQVFEGRLLNAEFLKRLALGSLLIRLFVFQAASRGGPKKAAVGMAVLKQQDTILLIQEDEPRRFAEFLLGQLQKGLETSRVAFRELNQGWRRLGNTCCYSNK